MLPDRFDLTVITPTIGRQSLLELIASIDGQESTLRVQHLLLWDDARAPDAPEPQSLASPHRAIIVMPDGFGRFGNAPGSALRAVGLLTAVAPWVTFADDDVRWDAGHVSAVMSAAREHRWASTLRRVWSPAGNCLGVDRFESVGDDPRRRVTYEMCDNNCMVFRRELGVAAAPLYRETADYNDDRLMYSFLKRYAGPRAQTGIATINQICPVALVDGFTEFCVPE